MLYTLPFFENNFCLKFVQGSIVVKAIAPGSTRTINENRTDIDRQEDKYFFCTFSRLNGFGGFNSSYLNYQLNTIFKFGKYILFS